MARCAIISPKNLIGGITLKTTDTSNAASSTSLPLLNRNYRGAWCTQYWTGGYFTIYGSLLNTDAAITADTFAVMRHNLPTGSTVQVRLYAGIFAQGTIPSGATVYDSGALPSSTSGIYGNEGYSDFFVKAPSPATFKAFSVTVSSLPTSSNANLYALHFGLDLSLSRGFSNGSQLKQIDGSEYVRTVSGGTILKRLGAVSRTLTTPFELLNGADRKALSNAERMYRANSWLVVAYPDGEGWQKLEYTFLGLPDSGMTYGRSSHGVYSTSTLILREV